MAAPSTVGTPSQGSFNGTSVALTAASGYAAGDALLAVVSQDGDGNMTVNAGSSSGWVKLGQFTLLEGVSITQAYFYKKNAAGPGSDDLTVDSATSERGTYILQPITGQDTATDAYLGAGASSSTAAVNVCNPPSLNPGQGAQDYLAVATGGLAALQDFTAAPTNYSGLLNQSTQSSSCQTGLAFRGLTAASSEDPGTFTHGSSAWLANTILVPPAAGGGGTTHFASASLAVTAGVVSAAKKVAQAALAAPSTFGATTTARKRAHAGLAAPFVFGPSVTARKRAYAAASLPLVLGVDTAAHRAVYGSLALALTAAVDTAAKKRAQASTVVPIVLTIDTAATTGGEHLASASLEISFGATTSAHRRAQAAASLPISVGTDTAARARRQAAASLPVVFGASVAGHRRAHGSATLPIVVTITTAAEIPSNDRTRAFQGSGRTSFPATSPRTRASAGLGR